MPEGLDKFLKATGEAIEKVPEVYDDILKPVAQETGKLLGRVPRAINAALSGCDVWILNKEYNIEETKKLLAKKLENVPPEKIVQPEPYVAVPALQAISYSMNNEELRELYANLLSKAMNIDTKDFVHPCFTDLIKQMSPLDAKVFKSIMESSITPLLTIKKHDKITNGANILIENISWLTFASYNAISVSINNLCRLGLIEIPYFDNYTDKTNYDCIKQNPWFKAFLLQYQSTIDSTKDELKLEEHYIKKNDLSNLFNQICILSL